MMDVWTFSNEAVCPVEGLWLHLVVRSDLYQKLSAVIHMGLSSVASTQNSVEACQHKQSVLLSTADGTVLRGTCVCRELLAGKRFEGGGLYSGVPPSRLGQDRHEECCTGVFLFLDMAASLPEPNTV